MLISIPAYFIRGSRGRKKSIDSSCKQKVTKLESVDYILSASSLTVMYTQGISDSRCHREKNFSDGYEKGRFLTT